MISDIMVFDSQMDETVFCPDGQRMFLAVMQGGVHVSAHSGNDDTLEACQMLITRGRSAYDLCVGDHTHAVKWLVTANASLLDTGYDRVELDEVSAIVLQDSAFNPSCSRVVLESALTYVSLRNLKNDCRSQVQEPRTEAFDRLSQALRVMTSNLDAPLTLHQLAAMVDCSPATLSRLFRQNGMASPMKVFAAKRLAHAKRCLQHSESSVSNIGSSLGFRDIATFSHFFRKHVGQSPLEYRQNCRWLI